ncbi:MAG: PIG-L deacetylase family protein, partial [Smithellaceae bacterium]|nr:PIG-L deacetylase family protein [Smithellaceae bacterium]
SGDFQMNVLVFAPHPDDEVLGCGGMLARLTRDGSTATVIYLTSGDAGSLEGAPGALAEIREGEARQGAAVLGISDLIFLRNPDGYLEYSRDNLVNLVRLIRGKRPGLVLAPHAGEIHPDHRVTNELVMEAIRRAGGAWFPECGNTPWPVPQVLCYEIFTPLTQVSYVEDITDRMDLKLSSLREHASQLGSIAYDEAIAGLNRFRGVTTGRGRFCECFQVMVTTQVGRL